MSSLHAAARRAQLQTWIKQRRPELAGRKMIDLPTEALGQAARELQVPLAELLAVRDGRVERASTRAMNAGAATTSIRSGLHERRADFEGQALDNSALGARLSAMSERDVPTRDYAREHDDQRQARINADIARRQRETRDRHDDYAPAPDYDQGAAMRDAEIARRQREAAERYNAYVPPPDYSDYND